MRICQGLHGCNIGRKVAQTDQGYQSPTPDWFGHVQTKILVTFQNGWHTPLIKTLNEKYYNKITILGYKKKQNSVKYGWKWHERYSQWFFLNIK